MKNNKIIVMLLVVVLALSCTLVACGSTAVTITFNTNGGSKVDNVVVDGNNAFAMPTDPTREGYTFDGWFTKSEGGAEWKYDKTSVKSNVTVYAQWTANEYTATFMAGEVKVAEVAFTADDKSIDEPAVPSKAGFVGKWEEYTLALEDITINAEYTAAGAINESALVLAVAKGGTVELSGDITITSQLVLCKDVVINGNGYTLSYDAINAARVDGVTATIKDIDFVTTATDNHQMAIHTYNGASLTVDGCTFTGMVGYYATTVIAAYDTTLVLTDSTFTGASQAVMVKSNLNGSHDASATITGCQFVDCGYAVFTVSSDNGNTEVTVDECTFTNCATFIANNCGQFVLTNNEFIVGEKTGSDAHFKNSTETTLVIDITNNIEGEHTTSGLVNLQ